MKTTPLLTAILVIAGMAACSKGNNGGGASGAQPSIKVNDVIQPRQIVSSAFRFYVDLSAASKSDIKVDYTTVDGTAKSGTDYTAMSGTLTIAAGQKEGFVDVIVSGDSLRRSNQQFNLKLSNPVNATMGTATATATIQNTDLLYLPTDTTGYTTPAVYAGKTLVWSDEFNGSTINTNNWNFETGNGSDGWGNQELEYYTSRTQNVFVSEGHLVIEARQESYSGFNYTSARMNSSGKQQFTSGRIDMRAKLPVAKGMWPALWMLGANYATAGWPGCGETDIMELVGSNPSQVVGSLHWKQGDGTEGTFNNAYTLSQGKDFSQQFHVFSLLWTDSTLQFFVDDQLYVDGGKQKVTSGTYPFNDPFFFIFNVAVGGNWPGSPDNTTGFPQRMFVDYVRVFQ